MPTSAQRARLAALEARTKPTCNRVEFERHEDIERLVAEGLALGRIDPNRGVFAIPKAVSEANWLVMASAQQQRLAARDPNVGS